MAYTVVPDVVVPNEAGLMTPGTAAVPMYETSIGQARFVAVSWNRGDAILLNGQWGYPRTSGRFIFRCEDWRNKVVLHSRPGSVEPLPGDVISSDPASSGGPVVASYGGTAGGARGSTTVNPSVGLNAPASESGLDCIGLAGVVAFIYVESGGAFVTGEAVWNRRTPAGVWCREGNGLGSGIPLAGLSSTYIRDELITAPAGRIYLELSGITGPTTVRVDLVGVSR